MRGQISLEYLLISLVSLSLIFISLVSLLAIRDSSIKNMEILKFRSSAFSIANAIDEVCALGHGNSRSIDITSELSLESTKTESWLIRFSNGELSLVKPTLCKVDMKNNLKGLIYVKNENGVIKVQ